MTSLLHTADPEEQRRIRRGFLLWLFFSVLVSALDISLVGPLLPVLRDFFQLDTERAQLLVSFSMLGVVYGSLMAPGITGRFRPSDILMGCLGLFSIGALIVAAAPRFEVLLVGRLLQGIGIGTVFPMSATIVYFVFPPRRHGRILGLLGSVFGLSFLIGPPLAGLLIPISWRLLFLMVAVPVLPLFLFYRKRRHLLPPPLDKPVDRRNIILMTLAMASLGGFLLWYSYRPEDLIGVALWAALTAILFVRWLAVQFRSPSPLVALRALRQSPIREAVVIAFLAGFVEATPVFVPAFLVDVFGVSYRQAAFMLMPMIFAMVLAAPLSGLITDKKGPATALALAATVLIVAFGAIAYFPVTVPNFYVVGVLIGIGLAFLLAAPIRYIFLRYAPLHIKDVLQGNITFYTRLGHLAGAVFLGTKIIKGLTVTYVQAFLWMAVPSFAILILALLIGWRIEQGAAGNAE